jgi:hypothetical protein
LKQHVGGDAFGMKVHTVHPDWAAHCAQHAAAEADFALQEWPLRS